MLQGSAKVYAAECAASPCFAINFTQPSSRRTSYDEFRKLNSKWQHKLGKVGIRASAPKHWCWQCRLYGSRSHSALHSSAASSCSEVYTSCALPVIA